MVLKARVISRILGVLFLICSTPGGMARSSIPELARASFFVAEREQDVLEDAQKQDFQDTMLYLFDEATLAEAESLAEGETSVEDSEEESRKQKRLASSIKFLSKCRILTGLSVKKMSKGVAKHPRTQDAQQERTAAIRFLQLAALAC